MPYSAAASGIRCSRRSSLRAWSSTSFGIFALVIASLSSAISSARLALTELALDRRHLLAKQNLALTLVEGRLGLPADLLRQSQDFNAVGEHARNLLHSGRYIDGLENFLLLLGLHVHVGGCQIR